jgi:CubicO group peptidase (beta-lactamase class C family)
MTSAVLERDAAGTPVGSSFLHATPRDLARLGLLHLADGCWRGQRLLPPGWVRQATGLTAPMRSPAQGRDPGDVQGRGWWLNRPVPALGQPVPWPGAPEDAYAARGHWGQVLAVIPSQDLIVVRTGDDREPGALDLGHLLALAAAVGGAP